ncbi:protein Shroom3 [Rhinophrynus dorsalis]
MMQISQGTIGSPWHQTYHSSSSTSDLSSYDRGYLRRSPDQYSSRGSMESLDHTSAYHHCHLSPAKSTNYIDQLANLHNKRDSAYSSFSTNSSIPEYHPSPYSKERSYSMENMQSRYLQEGIKHADIRYIKTVYDAQSGTSEEFEVNSASIKNRNCSRHPANHRYSGGPAGRLEQGRVFSESDNLERGPPMPPTRSDSYAVTRHHERPSSWSSLDQNRYVRIQPKISGPHPASATCSSSQQLKTALGDGHLHTVLEKSPESSPLLKPKQLYSQAPQPGQPMLPTGIYPVPPPEPHFAHAPQPLKNNNGILYPALAKEGVNGSTPSSFPENFVVCSQIDNNVKNSHNLHSRHKELYQKNQPIKDRGINQEEPSCVAQYRLHFSADPEIPTSSSNNQNESNVSKGNQHVISDQQLSNVTRMEIKNQTQPFIDEQSRSGVQEFRAPADNRTQAEFTFQNEWNNKTKYDISATNRNHINTDTNKDKEWGNHCNATPSVNNNNGDKYHCPAPDHRNKLESASFAKHTEDVDNPLLLNNNLHSEELSSPSLKKGYDFTRRRLSSSSTQSGKSDIYKNQSSVLDKISKIEQREQESQRSQAPSGSIYGQQPGQCSRGSNTRGSVNSIEQIRNRFNSQEQVQAKEHRRLSSSHSTDKAIDLHQLKRTGSVYSLKIGDAQKQGVEHEAEILQQYNPEQYVLQTVPDDDKRIVDSQTMPNKEDHWQIAKHDTLGFNRAYRNSVKDAQSKVLEATSYRRKDLEISPPQYKKPEKNAKRPTSALLRGNTTPVSPHAPKERHSVTPTDNCAIQESQGISYPLTRIGARRRLTAEQKKRSYSEPEKMNEVGASDNESSPQGVLNREQNANFSEHTVADRRRMFERDGKACSTMNLSKPELKQLQQSALADYIERKTGRRPSSQETRFLKERSQSTYFSGSIMDCQSISSTSSMNSLHEHNLSYHSRDPREKLPKTGRVSSTLPPGLTGFFDQSSFENNNEYEENRSRSSSFAHQLRSEQFLDCKSKAEFSKAEFSKSIKTDRYRDANSSRADEIVLTSVDRKPDKSASAEDLLDRFQQPLVLHARSRSSPAGEKRSQDLVLKQDVSGKTSSYASQGFRVLKSKDGNLAEKTSFQSTFQHHSDHISTGGEKQENSSRTVASQSTTQKYTRAQSLTSTAIHSNPYESRQIALASNPSASKIAHSSLTQLSLDYVTAEEYLYSGRNKKECSFPTEDKDKSTMDSTSQDNNSLEDLTDKLRIKKSTPPKRPPPPKIKCSSSSYERTVQQKNTSNASSGENLSPKWQSNAVWSSSSSEPETPFHQEKVSLRISESCLQSSSPVVVQDDEDDDVFVKEQDMEPVPETIFIPPSPPNYPPPSLEEALSKERMEKHQFPPVAQNGKCERIEDTSTQEKENSNKRYPLIVDEVARLSMENSPHLFSSSTAIQDSEVMISRPSSKAKVPQPIASSVEADPNSVGHLQIKSEGTTINVSHSSEKDISTNESTLTYFNTNLMSPEDVKSQELAKDIVNKDKSLADILDPESKMKTTMDLMVGLFTKSSYALKENNRKRKEKRSPGNMVSPEETKKEVKKEIAQNMTNCAEYYSTSAPKAELLKKMKELHPQVRGDEEQLDVNEKKAELIASLTHKLEILKEAKESLLVDIKLNNSLGEEVEMLIESLCKPNEFDKYKMFIGDLDKVVNLLLSLSGRLARVENVISGLGEDANAEERKTWNEKRKQLCGQHEDARELKENLDRREKVVMDILGNYLTVEQFQDYQHFVKMKSALLIEQRELDDKIKLGQEQLRCLFESLPSDFQIEREVPLPEERISSLGNITIPPPLTSSL